MKIFIDTMHLREDTLDRLWKDRREGHCDDHRKDQACAISANDDMLCKRCHDLF